MCPGAITSLYTFVVCVLGLLGRILVADFLQHECPILDLLASFQGLGSEPCLGVRRVLVRTHLLGGRQRVLFSLLPSVLRESQGIVGFFFDAG